MAFFRTPHLWCITVIPHQLFSQMTKAVLLQDRHKGRRAVLVEWMHYAVEETRLAAGGPRLLEPSLSGQAPNVHGLCSGSGPTLSAGDNCCSARLYISLYIFWRRNCRPRQGGGEGPTTYLGPRPANHATRSIWLTSPNPVCCPSDNLVSSCLSIIHSISASSRASGRSPSAVWKEHQSPKWRLPPCADRCTRP